ncbi:MAG: hypothetical protein IJD80_05200 [Oscillospiraceae bacterium]|nr:hypothetical protein [Oscillospiraceae bacterium]
MMTVLFKILIVLGWILLALLLLLMWVIFVPRHFWVEYSARDGLIAHMNIAWFRLRLYPLPDFIEKKTDKKEDKPAAEKTQEESKKITDDLQFSFDLVKQVVSAAKGIMKRVLRAIKFRDVSFTIPVYAGDIHKTQKAYGAATSAFYSLSVFLQKHLQLYYKSPVFIADFANQYSGAIYFYSKITTSPVLLLVAAFYAYRQYTTIMENNKKAVPATEKEINNG